MMATRQGMAGGGGTEEGGVPKGAVSRGKHQDMHGVRAG